MEIGNNDNFEGLDFDLDDDDIYNEFHDDNYQDLYGNDSTEGQDDDILSTYLKSKGIEDLTKINYEDENGNIEEKSWFDLPKEDQLAILQGSNDNDNENDLDDSEIEFLNKVRLAKMTPQEYMEMELKKSIEKQNAPQPTYTIDSYSDDELFIADLMNRLPDDVTDEELEEALNQAKSNEALYKRQVEGLRNQYKALEDNQKAQKEAEEQQLYQEQFAQYANSVNQAIDTFENLGDLDINLTPDDKYELSEFILGQDGAGINHFAKALNDPANLVKAAWITMYGEDVINSISDYYKQQIQNVSRQSYKKGLEDAKNGTTKKSVIISKSSKKNDSKSSSINDLYFD